ncbi:MAG: hypothetical protein GY851_03590 [bacterium]|nr:hypothetical protein [bacterium]
MSRIAVACFLAVVLCASSAGAQEAVPDAIQARAVETLRLVMAEESEWIKVHAAEALLWDGHPSHVRSTFLPDLQNAGPKYRIGVWRVLAQAAADDERRERYVARIREAFNDVDGPDRLHAAETLGKLGDSRNSDELRRVATEETGSLQGCAQWVLANSGKPEEEAALAALLANEDTRVIAAYALRFFKTIKPETLDALEKVAGSVPADDKGRMHFLSAWYVHAPADRKPAVKALLLPYAQTGSVGEKLELGMALARCGDASDIPMLEAMLADPEADARVGAAHAILGIANRLKAKESE